MNPNDPLTELLSSWTPRRPSLALKARLFPAAPARRAEAPAAWLAWAAPALACALLLMTVNLHPIGRVEAGALPGFDRTNTPLFAALRAAAEQSAQNALPVATFTWTNGASAPSTNASLRGAN